MSRVNDFTSIHPANCDEFVFGAYVTDPDCLSGANVFNSEIGDWVMIPDGAADPMGATWTGEGAVLAVTAAEIDNDATDNTKSRRVKGIGSIGEAEDVVIRGYYGEEIVKESVSPFEFKISDVSVINRTYFNRLRANPQNFKSYFGVESQMFGKAGGVLVRKLKVQMPLPEEGTQEIIVRAEIVTKGGLMERSANNPFN